MQVQPRTYTRHSSVSDKIRSASRPHPPSLLQHAIGATGLVTRGKRLGQIDGLSDGTWETWTVDTDRIVY